MKYMYKTLFIALVVFFGSTFFATLEAQQLSDLDHVEWKSVDAAITILKQPAEFAAGVNDGEHSVPVAAITTDFQQGYRKLVLARLEAGNPVSSSVWEGYQLANQAIPFEPGVSSEDERQSSFYQMIDLLRL